MILLQSIVQRFLVVIGCLLLTAFLTYSTFAASDNPDNFSLSYQIDPFQINSEGYISSEQLGRRHTTAGVPDVPFFSEIVPIPEGMEPSISVVESDVAETTVEMVRPVVEMVVQSRSAESLLTNGYERVYQADATVYGQDSYFPETSYTTERIVIEDQPHLRITFFPIRYNPVRQQLQHVGRIDVEISLTPSRDTWNGTDELSVCCNLPLNPKTARTELPVGATAIKIEVDEEGIYELSHSEIIALESSFNGANPNNFAMLTNGEQVAFQVIGGGDNSFDSGDKIRFFGWPYDGPRADQQYITNNVFWLWANGSGQTIATVANPSGYSQQTSFRSEITFEEDLGYTDTGTNNWRSYENEPDAWYWEKWSKGDATPVLHTQAVVLPNPLSSGADATIAAEIFATGSHSHLFELGLTGSAASASRTYPALGSYNITATIPAADLTNGTNTVEITDSSNTASTAYFNRLTVAYDRELVAVDDQLIFGRTAAAQSEFNISGFTSNAAVAWDITDRLNPVAISADVSGSGNYSYRVARNHAANAKLIAASQAGLLTPKATSAYNVIELTPAGGADWVAVTHSDFTSAINTLAAHRATYSGLTTHVVTVDDVVNQYGYGLPTPNGIRDYIAHAVTSWPVAPRYLLLGGDASNNPRERACAFCFGNFEIDKTYVPTFMPFSDRFIGQQPSDHPYALLTGSDELADIAVGRLTVETLAEANAVVEKIEQYETNLLTPQPYMQDVILMVDDDDPGAAIYCADSEAIADTFDGSINTHVKCLPDGSSASKATLRSEVLNQINSTGTAILNYRGHGSAIDWAGGVFSRDHASSFSNTDKPFVIITADCLDGHFAWYNLDTIGETYLRRPDVASAAHWSASGLGFSFEYNVLHVGFYEGLFDNGHTAIGDAIVYAKHQYAASGYDSVTGFSMNLQGDPAMELMRPDIEVSLTPSDNSINVFDTVDFTLNATNSGSYPSKLTLTVPLPPEFSYVGLSSTTAHTVSTSGNMVTIEFEDALGGGESAEFTLTARAISNGPSPVTVDLESNGGGLEINTGLESAQTSVTISAAPTAVHLSQANASTPMRLILAQLAGILLFVTSALSRQYSRKIKVVAHECKSAEAV